MKEAHDSGLLGFLPKYLRAQKCQTSDLYLQNIGRKFPSKEAFCFLELSPEARMTCLTYVARAQD